MMANHPPLTIHSVPEDITVNAAGPWPFAAGRKGVHVTEKFFHFTGAANTDHEFFHSLHFPKYPGETTIGPVVWPLVRTLAALQCLGVSCSLRKLLPGAGASAKE